MSGLGNLASARSTIGRLLHKLSDEEETTGVVTPTKDGDDEVTTPATPASKKSGGRKRKTGTFAVRFPISRGGETEG